jgi:sugar phosphate isomerase/epimerase
LLDWLYEGLDELVPVAEKVGTAILIENLPAAFLPDASGLMEALEVYGNDRIGVVYDAANAAFIGEDVADGLHRVKSRLSRFHISDTTRKTFRHAAVGQGEIDFVAAGKAMQEVGYAFPSILEIVPGNPETDIQAPYSDVDQIAKDIEGYRRIGVLTALSNDTLTKEAVRGVDPDRQLAFATQS